MLTVKGFGLEQPLNCWKLMRSLVCLIIVQAYLILVVRPGSWLQVAKRKTKSKRTLIIGVDILRFQLIQGVTQIEGDFQDESARKKILTAFNGRKIDLILSDMAPNLSGIKVVDGENIFKLVNLVLDFSLENLHKNGCVVVKAFETGTGSLEFRKKLAKYFEKVWLRKPLASKKCLPSNFLSQKH